MRTISINDEWQLHFDGEQYMPFRYRKGGDTITFGLHKGNKVEPKWIDQKKYFVNIPQALRWIVEQEMSVGDAIDITKYIKDSENLLNKFKECLK